MMDNFTDTIIGLRNKAIKDEPAVLKGEQTVSEDRTHYNVGEAPLLDEPQVSGPQKEEHDDYKMKFDPAKLSSFTTGAQRETKSGKGRYDLISPFTLHRLAMVMERGAEQKGDRNWELGIPYHSYVSSMLRHINQWMTGIDDGEDHLGHALWNLHSLIHTEEMIKRGQLDEELEDLPFYLRKSP